MVVLGEADLERPDARHHAVARRLDDVHAVRARDTHLLSIQIVYWIWYCLFDLV